jgi:hypothetical protein
MLPELFRLCASVFLGATILGTPSGENTIDAPLVKKVLQTTTERTLSAQEEVTIRSIVYTREIGIYSDRSRPDFVIRGVSVPKALEEAYKSKPVATLELLLVIVKGARPEDAIKARTLAIALAIGPSAAVPGAHRSPKNYDKVTEGQPTPRAIAVRGLEEVIRAKKKAMKEKKGERAK